MTTYRIELTKSAAKELERLPRDAYERCVEALRLLATNPFTDLLRVKKLRGADALYRVRVRDYRIVYEVRKHALVVVIIAVGHRKDVYR